MKVCDKFSIHEKIEQLIDNEIEKKLIDGDEYELIVSLDFVFQRYAKSEVPNKKIYDTYDKNIITLEVKCHLDLLEKAQIIL